MKYKIIINFSVYYLNWCIGDCISELRIKNYY